MTENFKILTEFVKDISSETPDVQTYIFVKDTISKYHLDISVASKALKNKLIEVNTTLKFEDKELNQKKSHFEMTYASIVKIDEKVKNEELKKILDLNKSESFILISLSIPILFLGFYPEPIINTIEISVSNLIDFYNYNLISQI